MELVRFPMLYRKGEKGKILIWEIYVQGVTLVTESYVHGGKVKESSETFKEGKNLGKSNETTPHEQAVSEAKSRWQKKKDKGYSESLEDAEACVDEIEGGYFPMLAKVFDPETFTFDTHPKGVVVQPKLDGLRATLDNGKFYSRSRKPFRSMPHLEEALKTLGLSETPLDGEFYNHDLKDNFEEIVSAIKRGKSDHPSLSKIEYHVFDVKLPDTSYVERLEWLRQRIPFGGSPIKLVSTIPEVPTLQEIEMWFETFLGQGYEGLMIRDPLSVYLSHPSRRSNGLVKYKKMQDAEFKIIGVKEGKGKLEGHVGAFICKHGDETFDVKFEGRQSFLKECFENKSLWQGKWLTVRFQSYTNKLGVPRFPIGSRLRDVE